MKVALTVVRELLWCRLQESGHDVLLERVAELLDAAASGAPAFCVQLPPQAPGGSHGGPIHAHAPSGVPQGFNNTSLAVSAGRQAAPALPLVSEGMHIAAYDPGEPTPYHPQDGASSQTACNVVHYGEAFGAVTPEAYVPHMVDREYALEEYHGSFLGPGWEEEAPEAELF